MDLLSVFFIYSHFDGCIIQSKAYEKSLLEMFLLCSIFKYGIFGAEESYMFLPRNALRPLIVAFFGGRGALASVYARILLKSEYYNWRKDTTPRTSPRVVWTKRDTNTIQLQSKQEWLRFVHFLSPIIIM